MPLFEAYVMVDWSGSNRRRAGRSDCIWIAHGPSTTDAPTTLSPPSRTEAEHLIRAQLQLIVAAKKGPRASLCRLRVWLSCWFRVAPDEVGFRRAAAVARCLAISEETCAG